MTQLSFLSAAAIASSGAVLLYCTLARWSWTGRSSVPRGAFMVLIGLVLITTVGVVVQAPEAGWIALPGAGLCSIGAVLVERSTRFRYWPAPFSELEPPGIDECGLRRSIRHPTYLGLMIFSVGLAVAVTTLDTIVMMLITAAWSKSAANYEEAQFLASGLRNEYREYQARSSAFGLSKRAVLAKIK